MKDNLFSVTIVNKAGHAIEITKLRINEPIKVGHKITAMRNKLSCPKIKLTVEGVDYKTNEVVARRAK